MRPPTSRVCRALAALAVLALCATGLAAGGPWLLAQAGVDRTALPWADPCSVETAEGTVMLTVAEARRATTAVELHADGAEAPDTSGIEQRVLDRLREGPPKEPGPSLTCRAASTDGLEKQDLTETGLTPRAQKVLDSVTEVFGAQSIGGYEPGGVSAGHGTDSAHYDGRAIDFFFRPISDDNRSESWQLTHWLVAHTGELVVANVIFGVQV